MSHAQAGKGWLRKYVAVKGRKEADLAAMLWEKKWAAISEVRRVILCIHVLIGPVALR